MDLLTRAARQQAEAPMPPEDGLLTTAEVGEILRRPEGTIRQWRHRNYGPRGFRVGGSVLYRRSAVDAWIRQCEAADQPGDSAA
jgi:hypothetical protein